MKAKYKKRIRITTAITEKNEIEGDEPAGARSSREEIPRLEKEDNRGIGQNRHSRNEVNV
jgi:hypothetical protein